MTIEQFDVYKAYTSQLSEVELSDLTITGDIPKWLTGCFISVGPAQFEVGDQSFKHWLDGFAMLKKFNFKDGKVSFRNRFLQSEQYVKSNILGQLSNNEFGTYTDDSYWGYARQAFKTLVKGYQYDNCNVNTTRIADHFIAMTESNQEIAFDAATLRTVGYFKYAKNTRGHLVSAHPHWDATTKEAINVAIKVGQSCEYFVYKINPNNMQTEILYKYVSKQLFYMHSFSITQNYIILFKSPLIVDKLKLMFGFPFNETLMWQNKKSSFFVIIDRRNGIITEIETSPFICLHSANAYENGTDIIVDLISYENCNPYDFFYLVNLQAKQPVFPKTNLKRYVISLISKQCKDSVLSTNNPEFPRINYDAINTKNYTFLYTTFMTNTQHKYFNALQKINVQTGKALNWEKFAYFVGEPIFVAKPNSEIEDEGILFSIIFNAVNQRSSLVILDAQTMQQKAEINLPFHLPFGLHGNFYQIF